MKKVNEYTIESITYFVEQVTAICTEAGDTEAQAAILVNEVDLNGNHVDEYVIFADEMPESADELAELLDSDMISTEQDTLDTVEGATYNR